MRWLLVADYDKDRDFYNSDWRACSEKFAISKYGDDIAEVMKMNKRTFDVADHSLWLLGSIDDVSGVITPCEPRKLIDASKFVANGKVLVNVDADADDDDDDSEVE